MEGYIDAHNSMEDEKAGDIDNLDLQAQMFWKNTDLLEQMKEILIDHKKRNNTLSDFENKMTKLNAQLAQQKEEIAQQNAQLAQQKAAHDTQLAQQQAELNAAQKELKVQLAQQQAAHDTQFAQQNDQVTKLETKFTQLEKMASRLEVGLLAVSTLCLGGGLFLVFSPAVLPVGTAIGGGLIVVGLVGSGACGGLELYKYYAKRRSKTASKPVQKT
jgi:thiol:disulfide interchange protein